MTQKTLKGVGVSPGKFKGKVKKIIDIKELEDLEQGNVLVTNITKLPYNQFTKRAGAIITNKGGMLSHVANLAREFAIPCVVIKNAMNILNNGDIVEVDADRGVIKIIE